MSFLNVLFNEKCPVCKKILNSNDTTSFSAIIIKACPDNHYLKEFHPALETYIESYQ